MAPEITIRQASSTDAFALRRLAALDDAAALRGEILLAEQGGDLRAALSLENGRAIANPFAPTAELIEMLRTRSKLIETVAA